MGPDWRSDKPLTSDFGKVPIDPLNIGYRRTDDARSVTFPSYLHRSHCGVNTLYSCSVQVPVCFNACSAYQPALYGSVSCFRMDGKTNLQCFA